MTDERPGPAAMTEADFAYLERLATAAADSGLYGAGAKTKTQLLMKLIYGRDLGIPVTAALSGIDIYDGKMELSSNLIAALLEAHPHYAYAIIESGDERCELEFFKDGRSLGKAKYDAADAARAGLADSEYYRHFPSDMFFARAMTRGVRRHCPGLGRGVAIYCTGELAKRTPEPTTATEAAKRAGRGGSRSTPGAKVGAGGDREAILRASPEDAATIRSLAKDAGVSDAELFNVLVTAGGGAAVSDAKRAAGCLRRALELLPRALVAPVCETLRQRAAATADGAGGRNGTVEVDFAALGPQA